MILNMLSGVNVHNSTITKNTFTKQASDETLRTTTKKRRMTLRGQENREQERNLGVLNGPILAPVHQAGTDLAHQN